MTTTVLAYIPSPAQGVWQLGSVPLRAYALFIIVGIIAALVIGDRRWEARGGEPGVVYDVAMWAVPFGLIGGRIYHVFTDWPTYFGQGGAGFVAALRIWDGGLGIWGAVALGGIGAWIACRRRGIPLPAFGDAIAPGIVLAQAIGRLGNYFNQELYGRPTTLPWGLEIYERRNAAGALDSLNGVSTGQLLAVVHPTFLYELLWNLLIFVVLIVIDRRFKIGHGRLFAMYVAGYCLGRFWIELMRSDAATLLAGIRVNSFTATFVFIGAVVYIMAAPKGRDDPATLRGRQDTEDTQEIEGQETAGVEEIAEEVAVGASTTGLVAAAMVADAEAGSVAEADAEASADGVEDAEAGDADSGEDAEVEESEAEESESVEEVAEADVEASADGGEDAEADDAAGGEDTESADADAGEESEVEESEAEESESVEEVADAEVAEADSVAEADAEASADGGEDADDAEDAEAANADGVEDAEAGDADSGEDAEVEE
ncbi:MAG: prolipoprotein diacylglyceryl transferase, partial [Mycobacterium sp.]